MIREESVGVEGEWGSYGNRNIKNNFMISFLSSILLSTGVSKRSQRVRDIRKGDQNNKFNSFMNF